jgi:hypothetical protein
MIEHRLSLSIFFLAQLLGEGCRKVLSNDLIAMAISLVVIVD